MKRRQFIENAGLLSGISMLPFGHIDLKEPKKYKLGYQLYSIRDEMAKDPKNTLKALASMGYEDFEVYGFDDLKGEFYGMEPLEFKKVLDDLGLTVTSGHYVFAPHLDDDPGDLERMVDSCIKGALSLDSKYITWPWIAPEQRTIENFKKMTGLLNRIGEQVTQAGLGFAYHNHGFEFEMVGEECGFDIIVKETDPSLVRLQLDMYWVMHAGTTTPRKLISEQPGRYVMWHIKDMDVLTRDYTELGNGSINYINTLPSPDTSGLEYFYIEQGGNYAVNSIQSAADSAKYFKSHLEKLLT